MSTATRISPAVHPQHEAPPTSGLRLVPRAAAPRVEGAPRIPSATFRLQFHRGFGFADARRLVPLLHRLGITHLYASPLFRAREGSTHGYDVVDPSRLNPELGSEEEFNALVADLERCGMALILDIVPNHMAAGAGNAWWEDVLEEGPESPFAGYFDIDWKPVLPGCENRVILPVLGSPFGQALENQELRLVLDEGGFAIRHWEHRFPLRLNSYRAILLQCFDAWRHSSGVRSSSVAALGELLGAIERAFVVVPARSRLFQKSKIRLGLWTLYSQDASVRSLVDAAVALHNGVRGDPPSFDKLERLLSDQAYVLAYWRSGREHVNYRRFFDINELVGLRVEDEEVFGATHDLVLRLVRDGKVAGLRIDHIDGLRDPAGYLRRLEDSVGSRAYVVVEKVLLDGEKLPETWPVDGTTGYEFLDAVNAVFVNGANLERLEAIYRSFTGVDASFAELVYEHKKRIIPLLFQAELRRLTADFLAIAGDDRHAREHTAEDVADAITEITARLRVYRTYIRGPQPAESDRKAIEAAVRFANSDPLVGFLRRVLLLEFPDHFTTAERNRWLRFVLRWQQFTGPAMAKGMEDTACYVYNRLISLNVVGGGLRPVSVEEFHRLNRERLRAAPHGLNATSTHDTKRSEDVRARINVLSELPDAWAACLARWSTWNAEYKKILSTGPAPSANDEILLYQVLLGAWPLRGQEMRGFRQRIRAFAVKAAREAKAHTGWLSPNAEYEDALLGFIDAILQPGDRNRFLPDFLRVQARIAPPGAAGSLAQVLLKITCPGVPDFYQGTLLWDFSLVDPDNRRPVDFDRRIELLDRISERPDVDDMVVNWRDGRIKLYTIARALEYRRAHPDLFLSGGYLPLEPRGPAREHVIAFARHTDQQWAVIVVPRLSAWLSDGATPLARAGAWAGVSVALPARAPSLWRNVFTGESARGGCLSVEAALGRFPVSLFSADE